MTTTTTSTRIALATTVAALCLGAVACGTETATPAASISQPGGQEKSRTSPRNSGQQAELLEQIRKLRAAQGQQQAEHPPGSFHADTYCRRYGHPAGGQITCRPVLPGATAVPAPDVETRRSRHPEERP